MTITLVSSWREKCAVLIYHIYIYLYVCPSLLCRLDLDLDLDLDLYLNLDLILISRHPALSWMVHGVWCYGLDVNRACIVPGTIAMAMTGRWMCQTFVTLKTLRRNFPL